MIPETGIYEGISFEAYRGWEAVSNTILKAVKSHSPARARFLQKYPSKDTPSLLEGRALHCLALEPNEFDKRYSIEPACKKQSNKDKETWAKYYEGLNGKESLTPSMYKAVTGEAEAIKADRRYRYIRHGHAETCIVWIDKLTGLLCKAKLDYIRPDAASIFDIKTTADSSVVAFKRSIWNYRYFQQAAFYLDGWRTLTGDEDGCFTLIAVEKNIGVAKDDNKPPTHCVDGWEVDKLSIRAGRRVYREALEQYAYCVKHNIWPTPSEKAGRKKDKNGEEYGPEQIIEWVQLVGLSDWALKECGVNEYDQTEE